MNGIDGFVSTALGIVSVSDASTVALLGDLVLKHHSNGLLGALDRGVDAELFVVVDNGGGGIFSFLPQADLSEHFEELFDVEVVDIVALGVFFYGIDTVEVDTEVGASSPRSTIRSAPGAPVAAGAH